MNINDKDFESNIKPDIEACEKPDKVSSQREKACFMKGLWSGIGIAVFSLAVATVLFLAVTGGFFKRGTSEGKATPSVAELDYGDINSKLKRIGKLIEDEYLYVEDTDAEAIESGIFKGFMYSLGDLYADYYSPEEFEDETANSSGNYCGIGVLMTYNAATNTITVVEVYEGSPAEEAGILEGDVLTEVHHENISILDFETIVDEYIKGEEGTYVNLSFDRQGESVNFQVERRQVEITTVRSSTIDSADGKKIGYINVSSFEKATVNQFRNALDSFDNGDYKGIIIDLRDNPGGVMDSAVMMADYILPDDLSEYSDHDYDGEYRGRTLLLYTENIRGKDSAYYSSDKHSMDKEVILLVNGNSASASEILTGALKDYGYAKVVGTKTYGKGIVQSIVPLSDGSAVKFTTDSYFTPSGAEIHGVGIEPDVTVEASEELLEKGADPKAPDPEVDNQLKAAIEELEK